MQLLLKADSFILNIWVNYNIYFELSFLYGNLIIPDTAFTLKCLFCYMLRVWCCNHDTDVVMWEEAVIACFWVIILLLLVNSDNSKRSSMCLLQWTYILVLLLSQSNISFLFSALRNVRVTTQPNLVYKIYVYKSRMLISVTRSQRIPCSIITTATTRSIIWRIVIFVYSCMKLLKI
jgi:hypothetical protein